MTNRDPALRKLASESSKSCLIGALLAAATLAVYWPATSFEFVDIDDWMYVTQNPHIRAGLGWNGFLWAFSSTYAGNWHPLTSLSHMLDCQLYALRPGWHHLTNVLLHTANTLLVFGLWGRLTGALWRSALVAGLFALHPLHIESVAWIAERKDVLSAFFFLLSLGAYVKYVINAGEQSKARRPKPEGRSEEQCKARSPKAEARSQEPAEIRRRVSLVGGPWSVVRGHSGWYCAALTLFALGLMAKPMLVTLPFVLLLLDYWPLQRPCKTDALKKSDTEPGNSTAAHAVFVRGSRFKVQSSKFVSLFLEKVPFLLLSAAASVVAIIAQGSSQSFISLEKFPVGARIANALVSYARYLGKTFWPDSLAVFYPYPGGWAWWKVCGAGLVVAALTVAAIILARRKPWWAVGWFWFAGMLMPVIGLVQVGVQSMADRYTYLPLIGIFVAIVWGTTDLLSVQGSRPIAIGVAGTVLLVACAVASSFQLRHWRNSHLLFEHAASVTTGNARAEYCLGATLQNDKEPAQAAAHFIKAIQISPDFAEPHAALGDIEAARTNLAAATLEYRTALRYNPRLAPAHYGLGNMLLKQGQPGQALEQFQQTVQLKPDFPEAHYQLAVLLLSRMDSREAIAHFRAALASRPDWLEALNNLAWTLATDPEPGLRNGSEALRLAARAVELTQTNSAGTLDTLSAAYAETGQFAQAIQVANQAEKLALSSGQKEFVREIGEHRKMYESGKAYRTAR
ncbi:MAG: hypothetical protein C5B50_10090 [Verrucomicrobia bacterium]|nr:MAG: hypothetical protein C5B50_10090 [Verrucomicrobiota bacterium]